jgi:hypothetical protein
VRLISTGLLIRLPLINIFRALLIFLSATLPCLAQEFIFIANGNGIQGYEIGLNGALSTPIALTPFAVNAGLTTQPVAITTDASGKFLYVVGFLYAKVNGATEPNMVILQFRIGALGSLQPLTPPSLTFGSSAVASTAVAAYPNGSFLYAVNGANIFQFAIRADGTLVPLVPSTAVMTQSPPVNAPPVSIGVDPYGRFVYGSNGAAIYQFSVAANGTLTPLEPQNVTAGSAPSSVVVDSQGRFVDLCMSQTRAMEASINLTLGVMAASLPWYRPPFLQALSLLQVLSFLRR